MILEIILGVIVLISLILLIILINKDKFDFYLVKINEAENNIDILLQKKADILKKAIPIINKSLKRDDFLSDIVDINIKDGSHAEIYDKFRESYNTLFNTIDENEKLIKNKKLQEVLEELNDNEEHLMASVKFYNDSTVSYNGLIKKFPSNIIRLFFGYKTKEFYKNEKREIFKILKEKDTNE